MPSWLSQQHCPDDDDADTTNQLGAGLTSYQSLLLESLPTTTAGTRRRTVLRLYFEHMNR